MSVNQALEALFLYASEIKQAWAVDLIVMNHRNSKCEIKFIDMVYPYESICINNLLRLNTMQIDAIPTPHNQNLIYYISKVLHLLCPNSADMDQLSSEPCPQKNKKTLNASSRLIQALLTSFITYKSLYSSENAHPLGKNKKHCANSQSPRKLERNFVHISSRKWNSAED